MTNGDGKPSFFARYIDGPKKERLEPEKPQTGSTDLVSQWAQVTNAKTFLANILVAGPEPTTVILERGAARGLSEQQLRRAKKRLGVIAFKEEGKFGRGGRWFWTTTQLNPEQVTALKHNDRYTRRLRDVSRTLGYRLQPMSVYPRRPRSEEKQK